MKYKFGWKWKFVGTAEAEGEFKLKQVGKLVARLLPLLLALIY